MTLLDLLTTVTPYIPAVRLKDLKTSVRYLAQALGKDDPAQCYVSDFLRPLPELKQCLDDLLTTRQASPHTVRNTRNNISFLFRLVEGHGIFHPPTALPHLNGGKSAMYRKAQLANPLRSRYNQHGYGLHLAHWPPALQQGWTDYAQRKRLKLAAPTLLSTLKMLEAYVGFLINVQHASICNVQHASICRWEELFEEQHVTAYIYWHAQRFQAHITTHARHVAHKLRAIARTQQLPEAQALSELCRELPLPEPLHDKQQHWLSRQELERVALGLLQDANRPYATSYSTSYSQSRKKHPGLRHAIAFQHALILRLLVRVPLRQRNIREMKLDRNLYRDPLGCWQVAFKGRELKIAHRNGRTNTFTFPWPDDLIPNLEEFLTVHRPRLPNHRDDTHLFLARFGTPYTGATLHRQLDSAVLQYTGKRFYPHLIRTIWATEALLAGEGIDTVAFWLNDRVETVFKRYHELLAHEHISRGQAFVKRSLSTMVTPNGTRSP